METTEAGQATVLRPDDELDLLGYQALGDKIEALLHEGRNKIVLDLRAVTYVNSPAVNALLGAAAKVQKAGGALALARVQGGAQTALQTLGMLKVLPTYATVEDAVSALAGA
jgi:anti-anti-sigma factor